MSGIAFQLAAMAVSYIVPEILDKVREHWWGRLALKLIGRKQQGAAEATIAELDGHPVVSAEVLKTLSPEQIAAIYHGRQVGESPPPARGPSEGV